MIIMAMDTTVIQFLYCQWCINNDTGSQSTPDRLDVGIGSTPIMEVLELLYCGCLKDNVKAACRGATLLVRYLIKHGAAIDAPNR
jgi:hypothetical protein